MKNQQDFFRTLAGSAALLGLSIILTINGPTQAQTFKLEEADFRDGLLTIEARERILRRGKQAGIDRYIVPINSYDEAADAARSGESYGKEISAKNTGNDARDTCDSNAVELIDFLEKLKGQKRYKDFLKRFGANLNDEEANDYLKRTKKYDDACLEVVTQPKKLIDTHQIFLVSDREYRAESGNETISRPFCSGVRLNDGSFLSAAHCTNSIMSSDVKIGSFNSELFKINELTFATKDFRGDDELDYQFVTVTRASQDSLVNFYDSFRERPAKDREKLELVGFNIFVFIGKYLSHRRGKMSEWASDYWKDAVRGSQFECTATVLDETGCVYYGCQTGPYYSGAPVFSRSEEKILGLHLRDAGGGRTCDQENFDGLGNLGFRSPKEVQSTDNWKEYLKSRL